MRGRQWVTWGTWAVLAAMPPWVVAGAAVLGWPGGGDGMTYAVVGSARRCLAGLGAGARRPEHARGRDARGAG